MLDMTDPSVMRQFGQEVQVEVVDRVSLTTVVIHQRGTVPWPRGTGVRASGGPGASDPTQRGSGSPRVNGWPASFAVPLGRGKVIHHARPRGWHRPVDTDCGSGTPAPDLRLLCRRWKTWQRSSARDRGRGP